MNNDKTKVNEAFNKWLKENYPDYPPFPQDVWQAATKASELEINTLNERVAELQSHLASQSIEIAHNDVTLESYAHKVTELQAHVNQLSEALEFYADKNEWSGHPWKLKFNSSHIDADGFELAEQALSKTPAQSLQERENEVIERCAKVCDDASQPHQDEIHTDAQWAVKVLAANIRALKVTNE